MTTLSPSTSNYADLLRNWRQRRRFSQLAFSNIVEVSSRHISFLETGRAKPSREMVIKLATALEMPKAETNRALFLAGYSAEFSNRPADDVDLAPLHWAVEHMLQNHMPYPAVTMDRMWNIKGANPAAVQLLGEAGLATHHNLLDALCSQNREQSMIENWDEVLSLLIIRLRAEGQARGPDQPFDDLVEKLSRHCQRNALQKPSDSLSAVIPTRLKLGEKVISIFSTIATFGSVQDVAMDELRIELMFPLDESSKAYFNQNRSGGN